jgi:hypothetical protein
MSNMINGFSKTCLRPRSGAHRQALGHSECSVPPPGSALERDRQSYKQATNFSTHIHIKYYLNLYELRKKSRMIRTSDE